MCKRGLEETEIKHIGYNNQKKWFVYIYLMTSKSPSKNSNVSKGKKVKNVFSALPRKCWMFELWIVRIMLNEKQTPGRFWCKCVKSLSKSELIHRRWDLHCKHPRRGRYPEKMMLLVTWHAELCYPGRKGLG